MEYSSDEEGVLMKTSFDFEEKNSGTLSPRTSRSRSNTPPCEPFSVISTPPKTIILGLWPHARGDQVEYYVQGYASLYPAAKVLLLHHSRSSPKHIDGLLPTLIDDNQERSRLSQEYPDTLVHLFGDDAATSVCRLLRAYRRRTNTPLSIRSIVLDSVPVIVAPNFQTLKRSPTRLLSFIILCITSIFWRIASVLSLWFSEPYGAQVRQDLHDPKLLPPDAKKCYIFPENDLMFAWNSPEYEGERVERSEYVVRRKSVDQKGRWTGNQERYWLGIENAWEGR